MHRNLSLYPRKYVTVILHTDAGSRIAVNVAYGTNPNNDIAMRDPGSSKSKVRDDGLVLLDI